MKGEVERDFIWDTQIFCKDKTIEHVTRCNQKKEKKKNLKEKYLKRGKKNGQK